jgi:hypothetical protein
VAGLEAVVGVKERDLSSQSGRAFCPSMKPQKNEPPPL